MDYLLALCLNALMVTVLPITLSTLAALGYPYPSLSIHFKSAKKLSDASVKTLLVLYVLPCAIEYKYNLVEISCIIASHVWTGIPWIYLLQSTEGKSEFYPLHKKCVHVIQIFNVFVSLQSSFIAGIKPVAHQLYKSCCIFITFLHHIHVYRYTEELHSNENILWIYSVLNYRLT